MMGPGDQSSFSAENQPIRRDSERTYQTGKRYGRFEARRVIAAFPEANQAIVQSGDESPHSKEAVGILVTTGTHELNLAPGDAGYPQEDVVRIGSLRVTT
jgi:hypothetical protein